MAPFLISFRNRTTAVLVFGPERQGAHRPQMIMALQHATLAARRPPQCPLLRVLLLDCSRPHGEGKAPSEQASPQPGEKPSHSQACHIRDTLLRDVP